MEYWIIYSTFPGKDEALYAAKQLVDQRLAACASVGAGLTSVYRWEGKQCEEAEVALSAKTTRACLKPAIAAIRRAHPYDLPCIVAWPLAEGFAPFLEWVTAQTLPII